MDCDETIEDVDAFWDSEAGIALAEELNAVEIPAQKALDGPDELDQMVAKLIPEYADHLASLERKVI